MKCAAAVMRRLRGSNVRRSSRSVNQTGPVGLKNETTYVVGVVSKEHVADSVAESIKPFG